MAQHGGDAAKLGRLGPGGLRAAVAALWQLTQLIRDENPDLPLVLLGHSWGSFLAQMLLNDHPEAYDALVLTRLGAADARVAQLRRPEREVEDPDAMGTEWLSSDLEVGKAFLDDPLTTTTPLAKLFGPIDTLRFYGRPRKNLGRDIPALLMVGRDDPVGGPRSVHKLADAYRTPLGAHRRDDARLPGCAPRDLQRDRCRRTCAATCWPWLDERFPARD